MKIIKFENNYELQANLFSFVIHLTLLIFIMFTVDWKTKAPHFSEVDLWDAVPTQVKKVKQEPVKKKSIVKKKKVAEIKKQKVILQKEAEIKLKKKKAAKKKVLALKKKKEIERMQRKILNQEKISKLQERLLEDEKLENLQEQLREQDLRKKERLALEGERDMEAGVNSGELERFKMLIQQKIHQNVNKQLCGLDDVSLIFEISLMPTGDILGNPKMLKSSKIETCDEAVERAILQSQPLPMPKDKKLFRKLKGLKLKFSPNAINE
jgi:colicin import membrane protein|tara:strand:- start:5 stop:805 length:801 start_codon:yes stop_codon:yes gene_type:complete